MGPHILAATNGGGSRASSSVHLGVNKYVFIRVEVIYEYSHGCDMDETPRRPK
jgi:hypothetical protein